MEKILVSACLLGCNVRYNAGSVTTDGDDLEWLSNHCEVIPFCPEVSAGLPIPRAPAEIDSGSGDDVLAGRSKVVGNDGVDVTDAFIEGARLALHQCQSQGIRYAVLTESSPSCGSSTIYDGRFEGIRKPGKGVATALLEQHGIQVFSQHDIGLLKQRLEQRADAVSGV